jgi:hypothetical protein
MLSFPKKIPAKGEVAVDGLAHDRRAVVATEKGGKT